MSQDNNDDIEKGYEVGYKKPPKHGRFSPGKSGNPSGRRKPKLTDAEAIAKIRDQKITIKIRGKERRVTTFEAAVIQTINKTIASGRPRDLETLIRLLEKYGALPLEVRMSEAKAQANAVVEKIKEIFERTVEDDDPLVEAASKRDEEEKDLILDCPHCGPALKARWGMEEDPEDFFTPLRKHAVRRKRGR